LSLRKNPTESVYIAESSFRRFFSALNVTELVDNSKFTAKQHQQWYLFKLTVGLSSAAGSLYGGLYQLPY